MDSRCVFGIFLVLMGFANGRQGKFWPIGFVRFENSLCNTLEGFMGTCYTRDECSRIGGASSGNCANGIGRCCLVQRTCGDTSPYNNTYFTNTGYPNGIPGPTQCVFTIKKCSDDICQVRLDFLALSLAQPDGNGNCITDSLTVIGGASNVPIICGENSGQHMYVNFNGNSDIKVVVSAASGGRMWNIKAAQIGCDCPWKAPTGCLQYYMGLSGTVNSFNYGVGLNGALVFQQSINVSAPGTREMANLNYGVCVQPQPGYCSIRWSAGSDTNSFTVSGNTALADVLESQRFALVGTNCPTDYVVIPNPSYVNGTAVNADRFCGNAFNTVISSTRPFVMTVVTNANEIDGDIANRGFSLNYQQLPCSNTVTGLNALMG